MQYRTYLLLGAPGSGKGTQGKILGNIPRFFHLSMGDVFREGAGGFDGRLSAENCILITSASRATATRDLNDLVEPGALRRTGCLKSTRYHLAIGDVP